MEEYYCAFTDVMREFASDEDAEASGWYYSREDDAWYSPEALEGNDTCDDCGRFINKSTGAYIWVGDDILCEHCRERCQRCESCDEWYREDDVEFYEVEIHEDGDEWTETMCEHCFNDENPRWSDNAHMYVLERGDNNMNEEMKYEPDGTKRIFCENCSIADPCAKCLRNRAYNKELKETTLWVYDTNFSLTGWYHPECHKNFKTTICREKNEMPYLYYGIEVEASFEDEVTGREESMASYSREVAKGFIEMTNGLFVAESDSSIGYGIEFISRPLSYAKWTSKEVAKLLEKGFEYLKEKGMRIEQSENNGLHIHMSRKFFEKNTKRSIADIYKDLDWVFQYYQPEMEQLSRRGYTHYCESKKAAVEQRLRSINTCYGIEGVKIKAEAEIKPGDLPDGDSSHHSVIAMRRNTIEVRCFKSTLNYKEILAHIEMVRNIAHTVRNTEIKDKSLEEILASKDSPFLDEYIYKLKHKSALKLDRKVKNKIIVKVEEESATSPF